MTNSLLEDKALTELFLDELCNHPEGVVIATNIYDSYQCNLVTPEFVAEFLVDCGRLYAEIPPDGFMAMGELIERVASGQNEEKKIFLRQCIQEESTSENERYSTTMKTITFHKFILNKEFKESLGDGLPPEPINSQSGINEYRESVTSILDDPEWINPDATLGVDQPIPLNCWITSDIFEEDNNAPLYEGELATKARDELGLIDYNNGDFLIRLSFLASSISKNRGHELARPVFSDRGNSRFRVAHSSPRSTLFSDSGWGTTTHLGKLKDRSFGESTGVCERVSSPLSVRELENLDVELLGKVQDDRGMSKFDDTSAYADHILDCRDLSVIKADLLALV